MQVVAGVAGSIVADKALPEVNAEQVSKELYYKQEVLKWQKNIKYIVFW